MRFFLILALRDREEDDSDSDNSENGSLDETNVSHNEQ